ncbi:hypothetical protein EST38_g4278 [Candolleomyces aberdarensis]|uniref:Uncharacterized protein n=1 Tax=Candolleomyces aberdarensis TaxID=2316362 RepID=A0A4Q2DQ37_9AGAR|nr:hypothetical protein EST38_g4278 [Candolleomyces aberdarensis]
MLVSVAIVYIQAYLGFFIYRNRDMCLDNKHLFATAIRAIIFTSLCVLSLVVALVYSTRPTHELGFDLVLSTFPILALFIFGTQPDLLEVWAFWRSRPSYAPLKNMNY